jgi:hypothetical protein
MLHDRRSSALHQKIAGFFSIDKTKLGIFLVFSLIALAFFASPADFFGLALPAGGLYYFFLLQVSQVSSQALGLNFYPSLGDGTFSVVLATTALGYFYLLSSYITYVARRKHDLVGMLMIVSVALVFISPFLIFSFPAAVPSNPPVIYAVAGGESCIDFPATGGEMEWDEESMTCYMGGSYSGSDVIGIVDNITFEILPGGNFTTLAVNNNGTLVVNGGALKNAGIIFNRGTIDHKSGIFVNDGQIESGIRSDYGANAGPLSKFVNRANLENNGYIYNYGNFTNLGSLDNSGQIQFFGEGVVLNAGRVSSNGRIEIAGEFGNEAEVLNSGILVIYQYLDGSTTNRPTIVNNFGEIINTVGELQNLGEVNNYGSIVNDIGKLENHWTITNKGTISNESGELLNNGTIKNYCDAAIEGQVQNIQPVDFCSR